MPESVLSRAQELVEQLSDADITAAVKDLTMQKKPKAKPVHYDEVDMAQMSLFDTVQDDDIIKELSELDISNMTPMDALNTLYRFQGKVKNRWKYGNAGSEHKLESIRNRKEQHGYHSSTGSEYDR